jgi:DnaJ-class molecular chaperone
MSHYETLNVARNASAHEIRKAYRRLALVYHPDKNDAADAVAMFVRVSEAFETLSKQRAAYDRELDETSTSSSSSATSMRRATPTAAAATTSTTTTSTMSAFAKTVVRRAAHEPEDLAAQLRRWKQQWRREVDAAQNSNDAATKQFYTNATAAAEAKVGGASFVRKPRARYVAKHAPLTSAAAQAAAAATLDAAERKLLCEGE